MPSVLDVPASAVYVAIFFLMSVLGALRPRLGVAGLIGIDPFSFYHIVGTTTITLPKTALIGMLIGLLYRRARFSVIREEPARPLCIASLLIIATTALSILQAAYVAEALRETLKALEYFATFVTALTAMREERVGEAPRIALTLTTIAVCLSACSQLQSGSPSVLPYDHHLIPRIVGPLEGPNQLSGYLGVTLPVITAFIVLRNPLPLQGEFIALTFGIFTLFLTFSRAGVVTTLAAVALVILIAPSMRRRHAALVAGTGALCGIAGVEALGYGIAHDYGLLHRFAGVDESAAPGSVGRRSQLWQAAITLWKAHPWLGIGAGNFEHELDSVGLRGIKTHANSLYLQSAVEGGLPLLGAQLSTVSLSVMTFARDAAREPFVLGAMGASAGLALHQIVDLLVFYPKVGAMWWIILALGCAGKRAESDPAS